MGIEDLPTEQRRRDATTTYNGLATAFGIPRVHFDASEPPGHWVYLVAPPGIGGVAKIGMGTADRIRRWTNHEWTLLEKWRTADSDQSRFLERTALDLLREAGAMDTPRLRQIRRGFSSFDGVTEWFDTNVATVRIVATKNEFRVEVERAS